MKKRLFIFILLFFVLAIIILVFLDNKIVSREIYSGDINSILAMGVATNIDDSSYFVVGNKEDTYKVKNGLFFDYVEQGEYQYSELDRLLGREGNIYYADNVSICIDVQSQEYINPLFHSDMIQKFNIGSRYMNIYCVYVDGKKCILNKYEKTQWSNTEYGYLVYEIDTLKKVESVKANNSYELAYLYNEYINSLETIKDSKLKSQSLMFSEEYMRANNLQNVEIKMSSRAEPKGVPLVIQVSDLPQNNSALYTEFPYLLEAKNDSSMQDYYVILVFPYAMNADEVVRMITEEGHEVSYDGVFVSEDYSIDGQKHYVNNFEEYMQYLKVEE